MSDFFLFSVDFETGALKCQYAQSGITTAFCKDEFARRFFEQNLLSSGEAPRHARQYVKKKLIGSI